jgi:hypothetical protein
MALHSRATDDPAALARFIELGRGIGLDYANLLLRDMILNCGSEDAKAGSASCPLRLRLLLPVLVALYLAPLVAQGDTAELTPCQGRWEGMGKDPWLEDPPYAIELDLVDGAQQCATVTYVGQCTARWVDCTAAGRWVHATEELVDPGPCAAGRVTLRCVDPTTLELRWEGEPGIMEATLHRVVEPAPQAKPPVRPAETPTPAPVPAPAPAPTPTRGGDLGEQRRGCGCNLTVVIPLVGLRRRRRTVRCSKRMPGTRSLEGGFGRGLAGALLACISCTPTPTVEHGSDVPPVEGQLEPARSQAPPAREPEPTQVVAPTPVLPGSQQPWVWHHAMPEALQREWSILGLGPTSYAVRHAPPVRYTAERRGDRIVLHRDDLTDAKAGAVAARAWTVEAPGSAVGDPVVLNLARGEQVVVAFRIRGGYRVMDFTDQGEEGIGPLDVLDPPGTEGPQTLQLSTLTNDTVIVRNRGAGASHQDELDLFDRRHLARTSFDATILAEGFDWPPEALVGQRFGYRWTTDTGSHVVERRGNDVHLVSRDSAGERRWDARVIDGSGKSWTSAVVLEHDRWIVAVVYSHRSTGSSSYALDRETGAVTWLGPAGALSSERRSGHRTTVAALIDAKGQLVVYGKEVDGDYRGVLRFVPYGSGSGEGVGYELRRR